MNSPPSSNQDVRSRGPSLRRSLWFAACITLSASLAVAVSLKLDAFAAFAATTGSPRAATDAEQRAILIAAVEHLQSADRAQYFGANAEQRDIMLENATVAICAEREQSRRRCSELPSGPDEASETHDLIDRRLATKLIGALQDVNLARQPLDNRSIPNTVPVDRERVAAMFTSMSFWEDLQREYPQADGILRIGRPVISARGDRALLYVETHSRLSGIHSQMELFELRKGRWKYVGGVGYALHIIS